MSQFDRVPGLEDLVQTVWNCPIIDNHAHNILLPEQMETEDFRTLTTEARGLALNVVDTSLASIRAKETLKELYGCQNVADPRIVFEARKAWLKERPQELMQRCFEGVHCILMDEGLQENCQPAAWHDQFTKSKTRRIMRIETEAQNVLEDLLRDRSEMASPAEEDSELWRLFEKTFHTKIETAIEDPEVVGFKSVICYRTGLEVNPDAMEKSAAEGVQSDFHLFVQNTVKGNSRLEYKSLNDWLVVKTLTLLDKSRHPGQLSKPIQYHTGLGDNDSNILLSDPARLEPLIKAFPGVAIVLLHASYPYIRKGGQLASLYENVFFDIGEVFTMLSQDGARSVLREAIELAPTAKVLYSSDGHFFPESYWLSNRNFRQVLDQYLRHIVEDGELTIPHAILVAECLLYRNANWLYQLDEPPDPVMNVRRPRDRLPAPSGSGKQQRSKPLYDLRYFDRFVKRYEGNQKRKISMVLWQWVDYINMTRTRMMPIDEFEHLIESGGYLTMTTGAMAMLPFDGLTDLADTADMLYLRPEINSIRPLNQMCTVAGATVPVTWLSEPSEPHPICPRSALAKQLDRLRDKTGLVLQAGFEIEVSFLERINADGAVVRNRERKPSNIRYEPVVGTHAWCSLTSDDYMQMLGLLDQIVSQLQSIGVRVQYVHAESGPGQYEFVLGHLPLLEAVDALYQTRQAIRQIAEHNRTVATLHPKPFGPGTVGTAAHVHFSLNPPSNEIELDSTTEDSFLAGMLAHLQGICAFSLAQDDSYARVADHTWSGGSWVCWGTHNREAPIRKVKPGRYEFRSLDGLGNVYLALAALIGAGVAGVEENVPLEIKDCRFDPGKATEETRNAHGVTRKLPTDLNQALEALEKDEVLSQVLGEGLVKQYLATKRGEKKVLDAMAPEERRAYLIERY